MTKWDYEKCYEIAKKYISKKEFQTHDNGAYKAALRHKWLNDYNWLKRPQVHNKKWTRDTCSQEAKKYSTLNEFRKNAGKAYQISLKNGWINEYEWLKRKCCPNNYWTKEKCYEEAKKYKTRTELREKSNTCYLTSLKNGWINDYKWIPKRKQIQSKWTKEKCYEIARQFKTKKDFKNNEKGCYTASLRMGFLQEMRWFESPVIQPSEKFFKTHLVYAYEDPELNAVYVGLTCNIKARNQRHRRKGSVFEFFKNQKKKIPDPIVLKDKLTPQESRYYEDYFLKDYKKRGYNIINKARTGEYCGSFGGGRVTYTYEKCYEIAKKYKYLKDFYTKSPSCYNRARHMKWLNEYKWLKRLK